MSEAHAKPTWKECKNHGNCRSGKETPERDAWRGMIRRCENVNRPDYKNYGGRGIKVCGRWRESFAAFLADMGPRPSRGHSIDRIDRIDNNGNYDPENCRWATRTQQANNMRTNVLLTVSDETITVAQWSKRTGLSSRTIRKRMLLGWSHADILIPQKPSPDFPLYPHRSGQWAKRIWGRLHYFGIWDDPQAALAKYLRVKNDLFALKITAVYEDAVTLVDCCNEFLANGEHRRDTGNISPQAWQDHLKVCRLLTAHFGRFTAAEQLRPADFEGFRSFVASRSSRTWLSKTIAITRAVFKWAYRLQLIDQQPEFGPDFFCS